uniref:Uncharacterized protein n=1 Tax=viral metagenome TaxID=1070528 RepID=A0A6C0C409_9ZZZZ
MFTCFKKSSNKVSDEITYLEGIFEPRPEGFKEIDVEKYQPISILKNGKDKPVKHRRRNSMYPKQSKKNIIKLNKIVMDEKRLEKDAFINEFNSEIIQCKGCFEKFNLGEHQIVMSCSGCNGFFHCHIAGACVGPNCSVILNGKKESLKYCMSCVNPYLKVNIEDNGLCLCKSCEDLSDIPNYYKEV